MRLAMMWRVQLHCDGSMIGITWLERGIVASTAEFRRDRNAMLRHMCGIPPQRTTCKKCMCRSYWSRMSSITSSRDQPITS